MNKLIVIVVVCFVVLGSFVYMGWIVLQVVVFGVLWMVVDWVVCKVGLLILFGVIGFVVLFVLLFLGCVVLVWVKDGVNWLLFDMLLFFVLVVVVVVQYGGLFCEDGWCIVLVMFVGIVFVMVVVVVVVDFVVKFECWFVVQCVFVECCCVCLSVIVY